MWPQATAGFTSQIRKIQGQRLVRIGLLLMFKHDVETDANAAAFEGAAIGRLYVLMSESSIESSFIARTTSAPPEFPNFRSRKNQFSIIGGNMAHSPTMTRPVCWSRIGPPCLSFYQSPSGRA
jgi:hypothetical protein